jgi:hypothetical protein
MAASGPLTAAAQTSKAAATKAYKAPRNVYGQPDLSGYWTNVTMTPETRRAEYGNRLVLREEEVAKLEADAEREAAEGDAPTDPNAPAPKKGGELAANTRPEFVAAGGGVGGYNRGWLDPGNHILRVNGEPRSSIITTPDGKAPPRKPGAPAEPSFRPTAGAPLGPMDSYEVRSLGERCIMGFGRNAGPPMLPNGFYNNNYQIVQTGDTVVIEVEMNHDARIIRLNGKHRTDGVRPYMGDSIGRWEGDTLVVETVNIPRTQAYKGSWENLKVTERFTRVGPTRINYKFTIDDPTIWAQPWGGEYEFNALDGRIYEYACHEGNYALPGILAGARQEEKEAAAAKSGGQAARGAGAGAE